MTTTFSADNNMLQAPCGTALPEAGMTACLRARGSAAAPAPCRTSTRRQPVGKASPLDDYSKST